MKSDVVPKQRSVWRFDPSHTTVEFSVKKLFFFTVRGRIAVSEGTVVLDETDIANSSVSAVLKTESINTGNNRRDEHLRGTDFLAADKHPEIRFESSRVGPGRDRDTISVRGTLTIKGETAGVELDVSEVDRSQSPRGEEVIYYVATTELDRFDFGIRYVPGVIGRKLKVAINVQACRPTQ